MQADDPRSPTLFDKYGGIPTVTLIVKNFYARVMADPTLAQHFSNASMDTLISHQIEFFSYLLGRPASVYDVDRLSTIHKSKRITLASYERVVALLRQTLLSANVEGHDIIAIIGLLDQHKGNIVSS